jgi:TnpA family transposase
MRHETERATALRPLARVADRLLPHLGISNEGIKYYASLVRYYSIFRLQQLDTHGVYRYLLCFALHRYQRVNDQLLTSFAHKVKQYVDEAKAVGKEQAAAQRLADQHDLPKAGAVLKLFTAEQAAAPTTPFGIVQAQAFTILDRSRLDRVADHLAHATRFDEIALQWVHGDKLALQFKRNRRIATGENTHFRVTRRTPTLRWTLTSPRATPAVNHPIFDALPQWDIASIVHFVNSRCPFLHVFGHLLPRYAKRSVDDRVLCACLVAWGTNTGLRRMGEISDISYQDLQEASDDYVRLETLGLASDLVTNGIAALPSTHHYDLGGLVHSSSDGQKFETRQPTFNARHGPKYFGLKKGIVVDTLVINHIPVNARIIGANEHESHYVFDLLFNNTTTLRPDLHSTDSHGTNEVNFALLHAFMHQFAPRYADIQEKVRTSLYGFQHPRQYADLTLRPMHKTNTALIIEEWDNVLRIFVSLARKTTSQSIIVSKLSSHARRNTTRRALWEYDAIHRSIYLLTYIDSPPLRQNVQHALNRGENYHQLRRAVSYANFGKLRFKTEEEQQIWSESSRLLTNCILYFNAAILSGLLAYKQVIGDIASVEALKHVGLVAWGHTNMHGQFEFTTRPKPVDVEAIVLQIAQERLMTEEPEP